MQVLTMKLYMFAAGFSRDARVSYMGFCYLHGYMMAWLCLQIWRAFALRCLKGAW